MGEGTIKTPRLSLGDMPPEMREHAAARGREGRGTEGAKGSEEGTTPGSPPGRSRTFPDLRGSVNKQQETQTPKSDSENQHRYLLERDIKLDFNPLPTAVAEYGTWRFHVEIEMLCCGLDAEPLDQG